MKVLFSKKTFNYWDLSNLLFLFVSLMVLLFQFKKSRFIEINGWCGNDGSVYCSMARGNVEFEPFSRRTLLPVRVRLTKQEDVLSFTLILFFVF